MKTRFYLLMAALPLLAACSNDEVTSVSQSPITFRVTTENSTRATAEYIYDSSSTPDFTVYAVKSDGNTYFKNVFSSWNSGFDTGYYWPFDGSRLTFYGLVGGEGFGNGELNFSDSKSNEYTVPSTVSSQEDLMYAINSGSSGDGPIELAFKHALSQVVFQVINNKPDSVEVSINSVTLANISNKAYFDFSSGEWGSYDDSSIDKYTISESVSSDQIKNTVYQFNERMMVLPTNGEEYTTSGYGSNTSGTCIILDCSITTKNGDGKEIDTYSGNIYFPKRFHFEKGKKYIYQIKFENFGAASVYDDSGNKLFVPININATVDEDWTVVDSDNSDNENVVLEQKEVGEE